MRFLVVTLRWIKWEIKWVWLRRWTLDGPKRAGRGTRANPLEIEDLLPLLTALRESDEIFADLAAVPNWSPPTGPGK